MHAQVFNNKYISNKGLKMALYEQDLAEFCHTLQTGDGGGSEHKIRKGEGAKVNLLQNLSVT